MPRDPSARENTLRAKARRMHALARMDLREPSTPRAAAVGPTSHAVKATDPDTARAIAAFLEARNGG